MVGKFLMWCEKNDNTRQVLDCFDHNKKVWWEGGWVGVKVVLKIAFKG